MDNSMQSMLTVFMALLLGHLAGDFPLQLNWMVEKKGKNIWPLLSHGAIHYALAIICLAFFTQVPVLSMRSQVLLVGYLLVHLLIDRLRYQLTARKALPDNLPVFLIDQFLHLITITIAAAILTKSNLIEIISGIRISASVKFQLLAVAVIYISVIFGGGYLIRHITKGILKNGSAKTSAQLGNAGLYIGWIERFLVITAMVMQSPALVGLILTGKSIARYPEFKEARFAEYFLIGTLLSISLSVLGGIVLVRMLYGSVSLK